MLRSITFYTFYYFPVLSYFINLLLSKSSPSATSNVTNDTLLRSCFVCSDCLNKERAAIRLLEAVHEWVYGLSTENRDIKSALWSISDVFKCTQKLDSTKNKA